MVSICEPEGSRSGVTWTASLQARILGGPMESCAFILAAEPIGHE
jgi:hypothetical protein